MKAQEIADAADISLEAQDFNKDEVKAGALG